MSLLMANPDAPVMWPPPSPRLHVTNPNMVPMTYHGMAMLGRLLARARGRFSIPPLPANSSRWQVALVELMPGQLLRARGDSGVGYKNGDNNLRRRHEILSRLEEWIGSKLPEHVRLACRANADCLDAVVNLAGALEWHRNPARLQPTRRCPTGLRPRRRLALHPPPLMSF